MTTPTSTERFPTYRINKILDCAKNDIDEASRLFKRFRQNLLDWNSQLNSLISPDHRDHSKQLGEIAHSVKGAASMMGCTGLKEISAELQEKSEQNSKQEELEESLALFLDEFHLVYEDVMRGNPFEEEEE